MKHALVTGAAGFVGSHLAEECLSRGWRVTAVDSLTPYYDPGIKRKNLSRFAGHPRCEVLERDLVDLDLPAILADVNVVFHLAAQPGVRASWGSTFDVYTHNNVTALQRLLEAAKTASLHRFVFASSSSVYGDSDQLPISEDAQLQPVSPYGVTKAAGEYLVQLYHKGYGVPTVVLRYFTVYGPRQRPDMALNRLISSILAGTEFSIYGDGEQTRDFTFVRDTVIGTVLAGERARAGATYNLGGGSQLSLNTIIDVVADIAGTEPRVVRQEGQRGDARHTAADTIRAREEFGFAPSKTVREGLQEQVAWHRGELQGGPSRPSPTRDAGGRPDSSPPAPPFVQRRA